jgi:hypothetical protein
MVAALTVMAPANAAGLAWDQAADDRIDHFKLYKNGELLYVIPDPDAREVDVEDAGVTPGARYTMQACDELELVCSEHSNALYIPKAHKFKEKKRTFQVSDGLGGFIDFLMAQ